MAQRDPILSLQQVSRNFGGLTAVGKVSFDVFPGEIACVIGPNGSGKTTLINLIAGALPCSKGRIFFKGQRVDRAPPHKRCAMGIARTFQDLRLFPNLSVGDNVMVGAKSGVRASIFEVMGNVGRRSRQEEELLEKALGALSVVGLADKAQWPLANLSVMEQKLLAIARSLATEPSLLLLDEPAGGLSSGEIDELMTLLLSLREQNITIVFVEHRMEMVMSIGERIVVLHFGQKIADDIPSRIQADEAVLSAYLPCLEVDNDLLG